MPIYYLIYTSKITLPASLHALTFHDICEQSSRNNKVSGLKGFLCFKQGNFLQYLEGDELAIGRLFEVLVTDNRHKHLKKIDSGYTKNQVFDQWDMQCINLDKVADIDTISPVLDYFETSMFTSNDTNMLISDLQRYYRSGLWKHHKHYDFKKGRYSNTVVNRFGKTHAIFLGLQAALILLFILLLSGTWLYKNW